MYFRVYFDEFVECSSHAHGHGYEEYTPNPRPGSMGFLWVNCTVVVLPTKRTFLRPQEGGVSEHMHSHLKLGDLVRVAVGGDFTFTDRMGVPPGRDSKILLLSAGIGVTPMIGALRWLKQREAKRCSDPDR